MKFWISAECSKIYWGSFKTLFLGIALFPSCMNLNLASPQCEELTSRKTKIEIETYSMLLCRNGRFFSRFLLFVQIMMLITETNLYKSMPEKPWKPFNIITHNLLCIIMIMLLFLMFHKMIKSMPYSPVSTSNPLDSTQTSNAPRKSEVFV